MPDIRGFPLRRNNTCETNEVDCGETWDNWHACCPHGGYCPGKDAEYSNNICCPDSSNCTALIIDPPICANSKWDLYAWNEDPGPDEGWFCCEPKDQGFHVNDQNIVGCRTPGSAGDPDYVDLSALTKGEYGTCEERETGQKMLIYLCLSAVTSTTSTATSAPTNESDSSSSHTNTGAIAGGMVGGVAGLAAAGAIVFFLLRRRKQKQVVESVSSPGSNQQHGGYYAPVKTEPEPPPVEAPASPPAELDSHGAPIELHGSDGFSQGGGQQHESR